MPLPRMAGMFFNAALLSTLVNTPYHFSRIVMFFCSLPTLADRKIEYLANVTILGFCNFCK